MKITLLIILGLIALTAARVADSPKNTCNKKFPKEYCASKKNCGNQKLIFCKDYRDEGACRNNKAFFCVEEGSLWSCQDCPKDDVKAMLITPKPFQRPLSRHSIQK